MIYANIWLNGIYTMKFIRKMSKFNEINKRYCQRNRSIFGGVQFTNKFNKIIQKDY